MDKPRSLSVKDYIIRKMAVKLMLSEKTIEAIVAHQFNSANEALKTNKTVEISGFGKFFFNQKKSHKRVEKGLHIKQLIEKMLLVPEISEQKRASLHNKLNNTILDICLLKPRIEDDKLLADIRRMEEQLNSSNEIKRVDRTDREETNGDL